MFVPRKTSTQTRKCDAAAALLIQMCRWLSFLTHVVCCGYSCDLALQASVHDGMDRKAAERALRARGLTLGGYLLRSKADPPSHVLTICVDEAKPTIAHHALKVCCVQVPA